jgi:hypothetical protein
MPVFDDFSSEEQERRRQAGGAQPLTMSAGSVPAGFSAPAQTQAPAPGPAPQQASQPTRFTSFDRVFNANSGGAQNMANNLAGQARQQGQAAQTAQTGVQNQFSQGVKTGTPQLNGLATIGTDIAREAPNRLAQTFGADTKPYSFKNGGLQSSIAPAQISADEAKRRSTQTYTGPNSYADVSGYSDAVAKTQQAAQTANALNSNAGRQAYLQNQYGTNGNYSQTQAMNDSLLAGRAGAPMFKNLAQQFGGMDKAFTQQAATGAQQATDARNATTSTTQAYGQEYNGWQAQQKAAQAAQAAQTDPALVQQIQTARADPKNSYASVDAQSTGKGSGGTTHWFSQMVTPDLYNALSPEDWQTLMGLTADRNNSNNPLGQNDDMDAFLTQMYQKYGLTLPGHTARKTGPTSADSLQTQRQS